MDLVKAVEASQIKDDQYDFRIGDTVKVYFKIIEGTTERIQVYEGIVIAINNSGMRKTFTVRKISYNVGVERIFPYNSPLVTKVEVERRGKIRRSKLYYMRQRTGKAAKVKEKLTKKEEAK